MEKWKWLTFFLVVAILILNLGCGDDDDDDSSGGNETDDDDTADDDDDDTSDDDDNDSDDDDDDEIDDLPKWLTDRPYLLDFSLWDQEIDMANPTRQRELGIIGIGNGRVYGNVGNQYPLSAWHNLGGPNYQRGTKWFSDKETWLTVNDQVQKSSRVRMRRVRNSAVVIIEAEHDFLEWTCVCFAPVYGDNELAEQSMIGFWIVRNISDVAIDGIGLRVDSRFGSFEEGIFAEGNLSGRMLTMRALGKTALPGENKKSFTVSIGSLAPGEETTLALPMTFTLGDDDPEAIVAAIKDAGIDALIESTMDYWNDWASQITKFETPDEKFNDLLMAQAVAIKINQDAGGGVSEMNQYSHTWLRDIHGPSLYYPLIGLIDDYTDMMNYLWKAILVKGSLQNAFELDIDVSNPPAQPDWDAMGIMSGRTRAEGPSLLVLEYENYYKATGDTAPIIERWGMLKHAVLHQKYVDGCLLHFSSDETFEDLMEMAFSENFLSEPDETTLSLYSSLLAMRAARFLSEMATTLGYGADATTFANLADDIETCMEDTFWMDGEGRYAVKADTNTREPFVQPFEDVNTMPIWLDALPRDDARVIANFESTMEELGHEDSLLYSPIPPMYSWLVPHIKLGVLTGMAHGYWLSNLDKMFHPMADTAFSQWENVFSTTGFTDEAVVVDDFGHLQILRDPFGFVCDVSSRFRSWESGVMGFAFLYHLTGYDASVPGGYVKMAPHLPPEWDEFAIFDLAYGDGRIDLEVKLEGQAGRKIGVVADENAAFDLSLFVPIDGDVNSVVLNGSVMDTSEYEAVENSYGRTVVTFAPIAVGAGETVVIVISAD